MRHIRIATLVAGVLLTLPGAVRPANAASFYSFCLALDGGVDQYYLNFNVQGNAILVAGMMNHPIDDHGPIFGSLALTVAPVSRLEMGLTVTYINGGDYTGPNFQHIVFGFNSNGSISYKRSVQGTPGFTQGTAHTITCPT